MNKQLNDLLELRNLKYKGQIKLSVQAWLNVNKIKVAPIEVTILTDSIYKHTLDVVKARERAILSSQTKAVIEARIDEQYDIQHKLQLILNERGEEPYISPSEIYEISNNRIKELSSSLGDK